jgi:DNA-binding beta-propeller fold protein YncE
MLSPLLFATVMKLTATAIALPGGPPVVMDYLAWDSVQHQLWVPAGNSGNIDVVSRDGTVVAIGKQPTAPSSHAGRPDSGASSASVGDGVVWVGSRANGSVCAFDRVTRAAGSCLVLPSAPDGLAWVAATHELWTTTPRDHMLRIVAVAGAGSAGKPVAVATVPVDGEPEGYAVDGPHGLFFTNLEDKDRTLAIDVKTRKVVSSWPSGCGANGPRGLAVDAARRLLFVACGAGGVGVLDLAHDGKPLARLVTGGGVDNIDYDAATQLLYVAAGADATLTIARVADGGAVTAVATASTGRGARVVVSGDGRAFVADSQGARIWTVAVPARPR